MRLNTSGGLRHPRNCLNCAASRSSMDLTHQQFESIPFPATDDWIAELRKQAAKEDARRTAMKKQWETLYDEMTHSKTTALFAFIRYDPKTNNLIESDVQNVLWYVIMWIPPLFIGFWGYVLIRLAVSESSMRRGSGVIWWPITGVATGALLLWKWLGLIHNEYYSEITRSVRGIAMLGQ
jgi:hypothetical protein